MSIIILFVIIIKPMMFVELIVLKCFFIDMRNYLKSIPNIKKTDNLKI